jgi:hypothetical protein
MQKPAGALILRHQKKVHRFTFSWQLCYKFVNTESREVEKWVKQLQRKYLMLTW